MTKINGVQIKNLKFFIDHEGLLTPQGDVWIDGKKQGFWSQGYMCDEDYFDFDTTLLDERAKEYQKGFSHDYHYYPYINASVMLEQITFVMDVEKKYKAFSRKNASHMYMFTNGIGLGSAFRAVQEGVNIPDKEIEKIIEELVQGPMMVVEFTSKEDFIFTINGENPAPAWFLLD